VTDPEKTAAGFDSKLEALTEFANAWNTTQVNTWAELITNTPSGTSYVNIHRSPLSVVEATRVLVWVDPLLPEQFAWGPGFCNKTPLSEINQLVREVAEFIRPKPRPQHSTQRGMSRW
jgi:hypothetical protein